MRNIKLILEYDGSRYDGWQRQGNTENTIQGKLEMVLGRMTGHPAEVCGAGSRVPSICSVGRRASVTKTILSVGLSL